MNSAIPITIPLLNPNEPEAFLSNLLIENGQLVSEGDILCTLETTKSALDLHAERNGYVVGLDIHQGLTVKAGELLCYLADNPDWQPPKKDFEIQTKAPKRIDDPESTELPKGLRITQPALALAKQFEIELNNLPKEQLITEQLIQSLVQKQSLEIVTLVNEFDPTAIVIYGGGGHGKALIELVQSLGSYRIIGIIDDGISPDEKMLGYPILGGAATLADLYQDGIRLAVNAVGGIGNLATRIKVFKQLAKAGFTCPAVIHPTAFIEASARVLPGVQIFPHAYIGSETKIGYGCIVNTGAIISHDCIIGDFTNLSPGSILAGEVKVGSSVLIGMGVTINLRVAIGNKVRIGNGATVKEDVPEGGIIRAGTIWPE